MDAQPDDIDPVARARGMTEFFGPRVPGQLGCVFDHSAADLVVGESTDRKMALFRCTQMVLPRR